VIFEVKQHQLNSGDCETDYQTKWFYTTQLSIFPTVIFR